MCVGTKLNAAVGVCGGDMKKTLKSNRKRDAKGQIVKTKNKRCRTRGCQKCYQYVPKIHYLPTWIKRNKRYIFISRL